MSSPDYAPPVSAKMIPCTCTRCGRPGKSKNPQWYMCGQCYYQCRIDGCDQKVSQLKEQIAKIREERAQHVRRVAAFVAKHGFRAPLGAARRRGRTAQRWPGSLG